MNVIKKKLKIKIMVRENNMQNLQTAVTVIQSPDAQKFALQQRQALALFRSGLFGDVKTEAQAIAKVMAGAEYGLSPYISMGAIHLIQTKNGIKPSLSASMMLTLIARRPEYDYRVITPAGKEHELCSIKFYRINKDSKEELGTSTFTHAEAQAAGLLGKDNWKHFPKAMLFNRAVSNGARMFVPIIFGGAPIYTPDELGVDVIDADGVILSTKENERDIEQDIVVNNVKSLEGNNNSIIDKNIIKNLNPIIQKDEISNPDPDFYKD